MQEELGTRVGHQSWQPLLIDSPLNPCKESGWEHSLANVQVHPLCRLLVNRLHKFYKFVPKLHTRT